MSDEQEQSRPKGAGSDPRSHAQMGHLLRQVYGTVITEPVPDRFSSLLEQLAQKSPDIRPVHSAEEQPAAAKEAP